jgi:formylglycine-generating enzyme required for sulfatase activity
MRLHHTFIALSLIAGLSTCAESQDKSPDAGPVSSEQRSSTPAISGTVSELPGREPKTLTLDLGDGVKMELVLVPAGRFMMGSPEGEEKSDSVGALVESPPHAVEISRPFFMGKYEVTNAQYRRFKPNYSSGSDNSIDYSWGSIVGIDLNGDDQPVARVQWHDAIAFCEWLSRKSGKHIRLPAEAEWEYACRAGTTTPFHFGSTISTSQVNYDGGYIYGNGLKGEFRKKTTNIGSFQPNAFGLYDMHGNLWEWCSDRPDDPKAPSSDRVVRGGSWLDKPGTCRSAIRFTAPPDFRRADFGFRVVASATP